MPFNPNIHHRHSIRLRGYDYARAGAYFVTIVMQRRECLLGNVAEGEMALNDAGRMIEKWWLELNHKFPSVDTDEYVVMPNHFHGIVVITPPDTVGADLRVGPVGGEHPNAGEHPNRGEPIGGEHTGSPLPPNTESGQYVGLGEPTGGEHPNRGEHAGGEHTGSPLPPNTESGQFVGLGEHAGGEHPNAGEHTGSPLPTIIQWFKTMTTNEYIRGVKQLGWPSFPGKLWQRNYYEHVVRDERDLERIRRYIVNNPNQWAMDAENPAWKQTR
jgi:REP element-mobilizing transposase RayT